MVPDREEDQEDLERSCQGHKLNKEDAMDRSRWRNLIKDV